MVSFIKQRMKIARYGYQGGNTLFLTQEEQQEMERRDVVWSILRSVRSYWCIILMIMFVYFVPKLYMYRPDIACGITIAALMVVGFSKLPFAIWLFLFGRYKEALDGNVE